MMFPTSNNSITILPEGYEPKDFDVICAKGKYSYSHPGNKRFRSIVEASAEDYRSCKSKDNKSNIVMQIMTFCYENKGGFIRKDHSGNWYEIGDEAAREKIGQSLREAITRADPVKKNRKKLQRAANRLAKKKYTAAMITNSQFTAPQVNLTPTKLTPIISSETLLSLSTSVLRSPLTEFLIKSSPDQTMSSWSPCCISPKSVQTTITTTMPVTPSPIEAVTDDLFEDFPQLLNSPTEDLLDCEELFDIPLHEIKV